MPPPLPRPRATAAAIYYINGTAVGTATSPSSYSYSNVGLVLGADYRGVGGGGYQYGGNVSYTGYIGQVRD